MKVLKILTLVAGLAVMSISVTGSASAQSTVTVDCSGLVRTACDAAVANIRRAPYVGPIRPASEPMACARVISYRPVPIEWVDSSRQSNWRNGTLITSTGIPYTETFILNSGWVVTESCIPRRLLSGVGQLTLCTGLYAEGFHWNLSADELQQMQATGHFRSYVPFLEHNDRDSLSRDRVRAAYRARYGV